MYFRKHVECYAFFPMSTVLLPGLIHPMLTVSHESLKHHFAHAFEVVHHVTHTPLTVEPCPRPSKRQPFVTTKGFTLGGMLHAFPKGAHRARFGPVALFYVFEKIRVTVPQERLAPQR